MLSSRKNQRVINNKNSLPLLSVELRQHASLLSISSEEVAQIISKNKTLIIDTARDKGLDLELDAHRALLLNHILSAYFDAEHRGEDDKYALNSNTLNLIPESFNSFEIEEIDDESDSGVRATMKSKGSVADVLGTKTDLMYVLQGAMLKDYSKLQSSEAGQSANVLRPMPLMNLGEHLQVLVYPNLKVGQKTELKFAVCDFGHYYAVHLAVTKQNNHSVSVHSSQVTDSLSSTSSSVKDQFRTQLKCDPVFIAKGKQSGTSHCMDHTAHELLQGVADAKLNPAQKALRDEKKVSRFRDHSVQAILAADPSLQKQVGDHDAVREVKSNSSARVQKSLSAENRRHSTSDVRPQAKAVDVPVVAPRESSREQSMARRQSLPAIKKPDVKKSAAEQEKEDRLLAILFAEKEHQAAVKKYKNKDYRHTQEILLKGANERLFSENKNSRKKPPASSTRRSIRSSF